MKYKVIFDFCGTVVYQGEAKNMEDSKYQKHISLAMSLNKDSEVVVIVQQKDGNWKGVTLREEE